MTLSSNSTKRVAVVSFLPQICLGLGEGSIQAVVLLGPLPTQATAWTASRNGKATFLVALNSRAAKENVVASA